METQTAFDLNNATRRWRDGLTQSPHFREEDLAELEAHLRDAVAELQGRGLTGEEAFLLASRRLGNPARLDSGFAKVNRGQVWLNRVLWMLIGIQGWGLLGSIAHVVSNVAVLGGLTGVGYMFPHSADYSSGNLFAAALFALAHLLALTACIAGCWWLVRRKEDTAHKAAVKALQRPVLLGLGLCVFLLTISLSSSVVWRLLVFKYYAPEAIGSIAIAQSLGLFPLTLLQTLAFVVLTIILFRRRVHLGTAS